MFLGERRSLHRRYRKRSGDGDGPESRSAASASASGSVAELEETFSEPASEDEDDDSNDRMPLLRPLRRRSRGSRSGGGSSRGGSSSVGSVGGGRGSGSVGKAKKTRMTTSLPGASPRKLLRLGRGMGRHHHHRGADTEDEEDDNARQYYEYESDGSDASSAYSPPGGSDDHDESFETAEAEAAVQRGERLAEDGDAGRDEREEDDWTEASAAAAASVMALAEAVRRGGGGSGENVDFMEIAETNIRRRDLIMYDETEDASSLPSPPPPPPPLMEEEEESEEAGTSHVSHEASTTDADASLDLEHYHDAPEEEQKEDDPAPPPPPPPPPTPPSPSSPLWDVGQYGEAREEDDLFHLMMPSSPSAMDSAQRSKYRKYVATLPAGGVTFADDHSACSVPLAHVQRVAPLPRECYGGGVVRGRKGAPEEEEEKEDADDAGCLEFDNDRGSVETDADTGRAAAVLLISPSTKQFELVRVPLSLFSFSEEQRGQRNGGGGDSGPSSPTCGEVLAKARKRAIFRPLRKQRYTSLCEMPPLQASSSEESSEDMGGGVVVIKSSKKVTEDASPPAPPPCEMINALRIDTYGIGGESGKGNNGDGDWADEVLVAVPKGLTASQASELARPILSDATMRRLIRERLSAADAAEAKKKRRAALRRKRADKKRQIRAKKASKDRSVVPARPENVSNARVALKVLLLTALALALGFALTATAFALFGTRESHFIAGTTWPLLAPVVPPAPTPGYGEDNSVEHKDCCRKPAEATSAAQAGGLWFSIAWGTK